MKPKSIAPTSIPILDFNVSPIILTTTFDNNTTNINCKIIAGIATIVADKLT